MPMLWHPRQHLGTSWGGGVKVLAPQVILAMELINSIRIIFFSNAPLSEGAGGVAGDLGTPARPGFENLPSLPRRQKGQQTPTELHQRS